MSKQTDEMMLGISKRVPAARTAAMMKVKIEGQAMRSDIARAAALIE